MRNKSCTISTNLIFIPWRFVDAVSQGRNCSLNNLQLRPCGTTPIISLAHGYHLLLVCVSYVSIEGTCPSRGTLRYLGRSEVTRQAEAGSPYEANQSQT